MQSQGMQCMMNSVCPLLLIVITLQLWTKTEADMILYNGDVMYRMIGKGRLCITNDIPQCLSVDEQDKKLQKMNHILDLHSILIVHEILGKDRLREMLEQSRNFIMWIYMILL